MRWWILLALGCGDPSQGTSVGNPNKTLLRVAPAGGTAQLSMAEVVVASIVVRSASGETEEIEPPDEVDVLEGVPLELPLGDWAEVSLELSSTLDIEGDDGGGLLDLALDVGTVGVTAARMPFELDEPHVFELASDGWLTPERAGWTRGDDHVVRPGDDLHDALVDEVQTGSSLRLR